MKIPRTEISSALENKNFNGNILIIIICLLKSLIDGTLSNENLLFWNKHKKNRYTPVLLYKRV